MFRKNASILMGIILIIKNKHINNVYIIFGLSTLIIYIVVIHAHNFFAMLTFHLKFVIKVFFNLRTYNNREKKTQSSFTPQLFSVNFFQSSFTMYVLVSLHNVLTFSRVFFLFEKIPFFPHTLKRRVLLLIAQLSGGPPLYT